jgi:hypothetical protein
MGKISYSSPCPPPCSCHAVADAEPVDMLLPRLRPRDAVRSASRALGGSREAVCVGPRSSGAGRAAAAGGRRAACGCGGLGGSGGMGGAVRVSQ